MNGILDAENDILPKIGPRIGRPRVWYKTTISCFRLSELAWHYRCHGWQVYPLLVVRDVRSVWASLLKKPYACNGITAEDPPLRMRLYRFKEEWQRFREMNWPILRYESLLEEPEKALHAACDALHLAWDEAMVTWPKPDSAIADTRWGSETFRDTRGRDLFETIAQHCERPNMVTLPVADLVWLEQDFRQFNRENGYPIRMRAARCPETEQQRSAPSFQVTRRYEWETKRKPIRWLLLRLGVPYRKLIERRSIKRAA
jgi:hypothetical protein